MEGDFEPQHYRPMPYRVGQTRLKRRHFIREWRKHRLLTQEQLAERISASTANLSRVESGQQNYTQGMLEAIAEALQTDAASLLMRNPASDEAIWSIWDSAKPGQRQQIIEIAKTITKAVG